MLLYRNDSIFSAFGPFKEFDGTVMKLLRFN